MKKTDPLIVILGHENDEDGNLSEIALSRVNTGITFAHEWWNAQIILTGNYSKNKEQAHAYWMAVHMINMGLDPRRIYAYIYSRNTVEDFYFLEKLLKDRRYKPSKCLVITSEIHAPRCHFLAKYFLSFNGNIYITRHPESSLEDVHVELQKFFDLTEKGVKINEDSRDHPSPYELNSPSR